MVQKSTKTGHKRANISDQIAVRVSFGMCELSFNDPFKMPWVEIKEPLKR
jgi:hypothetical protein